MQIVQICTTEKVSIIKFDLIILDIMMPGKNGLEFIEQNKSKIDTPIILLTAKGEAPNVLKDWKLVLMITYQNLLNQKNLY